MARITDDDLQVIEACDGACSLRGLWWVNAELWIRLEL